MLIVKYEEIRKNPPAIGQLNSNSVFYADVKKIYIYQAYADDKYRFL